MRAIAFERLTAAPLAEIAAHMSDPRMAEHLPLLTGVWDEARAREFVAGKEARWARDGLGHWAIFADERYAGWGGFQREGEDWDFGLVLRPDRFGLGPRIFRKALAFAKADARIPRVTFLLPLSRMKLGALRRLGAERVGECEYGGATFQKFMLITE